MASLQVSLRSTFAIDALISVVAGVATLAFASALAPQLDLRLTITQAIGLFMLVYAAALGGLAWTRGRSRRWGRMVAIGNALWVAASLLLALAPMLSPTPLGRGLILAQAAAVGLLALAQWRAADRTTWA